MFDVILLEPNGNKPPAPRHTRKEVSTRITLPSARTLARAIAEDVKYTAEITKHGNNSCFQLWDSSGPFYQSPSFPT